MLEYVPEEIFIKILSYVNIRDFRKISNISMIYKNLLNTEKTMNMLLLHKYPYVCNLARNKQFNICSFRLYYDIEYSNHNFDNYLKYGEINSTLFKNVILELDHSFMNLLAHDTKFTVPSNFLDILKDIIINIKDFKYSYQHNEIYYRVLSVLYKTPKFRNTFDILELLDIFIYNSHLENSKYIITDILTKDEYNLYITKHIDNNLLMAYINPDKCKNMSMGTKFNMSMKLSQLGYYTESNYICDNFLDDEDKKMIQSF
uniref:F-box domain-containing protein n=1 Tax=Pithovirus LCPAC101 TaxID=2506586 RepID=A0A481Z2L1_9VIRU|nr:MAG: hypothetical protein LCPAC101_02650 [Pithovirus LCPAC101]